MHISTVIILFKYLSVIVLVSIVNSKQFDHNYAAVDNVVVVTESPEVIDNKTLSSESNVLTQALNDFNTLIYTILDLFSSSPFRDDTQVLLNKTIDRLTDGLELFGAKMLNATEVVAKEIFIILKHKLNNIDQEFQDLSRLTDEKFERVITYVNNTMMEQSLNMEAWASKLKRQLRSMNDTTVYRKICPAIDALIKDTTDELSGCCNIVIKPVRSICRNVRIILQETFQVVADVVETVDNCIFSEKKFDSMVISCVEDIYDDVSSLTDRVVALRHALLAKLPSKIMLSKFCISMVSVSMETRKSSVEQQIVHLNRN